MDFHQFQIVKAANRWRLW